MWQLSRFTRRQWLFVFETERRLLIYAAIGAVINYTEISLHQNLHLFTCLTYSLHLQDNLSYFLGTSLERFDKMGGVKCLILTSGTKKDLRFLSY